MLEVLTISLLGLGVVAVLTFIRQCMLQSKYLTRYKKTIREDNDEIVRVWERESPDETSIEIERTIKPPRFFSPVVRYKETFTKKE